MTQDDVHEGHTPVSPGRPTQYPRPAKLLGDPLFLVASAVLLFVLAPYVAPVLSEEQRWWWDNVYGDLVLYGVCMAATLWGLGAVSVLERRFWQFLAFSMGMLTALFAVWAVTAHTLPSVFESTGLELVSQAVYLLFYVGFAMALEDSRPVWDVGAIGQLGWMRTAGLGVLLGGLLLYFVVVPVMVDSWATFNWVPLLLVYASLDALFCLQFFRARERSRDPRWRSILGWVGLALGAWTVTDFAEAATYAGWLGEVRAGHPLELQWYVPVFVFVLAARLHLADPAPTEERAEPPRLALAGGGPLIAYGAALPFIHLTLYATGFGDPDMQGMREAVVLPTLVVIGVLAFVYHRRVEAENRQAHEELRAERARYRSFIESSVEGVAFLAFQPPVPTDADEMFQVSAILDRARIVEANDVMAGMLGAESAHALVGEALDEVVGPSWERETNLQSIRGFVRSGYRATRAPFEFENEAGVLRHFEASMVGVTDEHLLRRAWLTQVDVTARHEAEEARERLERQLRRTQRLETIGTLAGGIAHDFNNMLAPILGFTELVLEALPDDDEETRAHLAQVTRAALRAKELVRQILAVGRQQEGNRTVVDLTAVVDDAVALLRQSLPAYVAFDTRHAPDCPPVFGDAGQFHQVVMNLCTNARQAIGGQRGTIRVTVEAREVEEPLQDPPLDAGRYAVLTVSDDGAGMSPEVLDRAFEAFFTTKDVGEGSGLGLSVSHGIVESHGGGLRLESTQGVGTTATVFLPAAEEVPLSDDEPAGAQASAGRQARILLVDDDGAVAGVGSAMLRSLGYEVTTFLDAEEARSALVRQARDYDLLVTDHTMPMVSGPELAAVARRQVPDMPVVIASGYRLSDENGLDATVTFLQKPYSKGELAAAVSSALAGLPVGRSDAGPAGGGHGPEADPAPPLA